jgi:hypothetical protein
MTGSSADIFDCLAPSCANVQNNEMNKKNKHSCTREHTLLALYHHGTIRFQGKPFMVPNEPIGSSSAISMGYISV